MAGKLESQSAAPLSPEGVTMVCPCALACMPADGQLGFGRAVDLRFAESIADAEDACWNVIHRIFQGAEMLPRC